MEEMIKRILTNEIVYVPEKDIDSCVKSVVGVYAADLLIGLIFSEKRKNNYGISNLKLKNNIKRKTIYKQIKL